MPLGTPLSDATEEKQWRKMLQRAIDVRNRHRDLQTQECRLCRRLATESMLHLVQCMWIMPLWDRVLKFTVNVLGEPQARNKAAAIIFNIVHVQNQTLFSTAACAFIRHAFNCFYRAFVLVDTTKRRLEPVYIFNSTLVNFKRAVLAYGESIKIFRTTRMRTSRKKHVPEQALIQFSSLITFDENTYEFTLTQIFRIAIADSDTEVADYEKNTRGQ